MEMITVRSSPDLEAAYRKLLASDWTKAFPEQVLELLWSSISADAVSRREYDPLMRLLDPTEHGPFPTEVFQTIVLRVCEGGRFVRLSGFPELPSVYVPPKHSSSFVRQATRITTYLTLSVHTSVSGNTAFFLDGLALAFQAAIHFVLPGLRKTHPPEHALLLYAAVLFAIGYAAGDEAHYAYLMSMIHGYMGDDDQRIRSLYASFHCTHPEDHSYLTKAQELWSELLDQDKEKEAKQFLWVLHRSSLPEHQAEVQEMVEDALEFMRHTPHRDVR